MGPKISETILEFMRPILHVLGPELTAEELRQTLKVAVTAWNAVIFDESARGTDYVARARRLHAGQPGPQALFDELVHRKQTLFGGDRRLIGEAEVIASNPGEVRVRVHAHEPPPLGEENQQGLN